MAPTDFEDWKRLEHLSSKGALALVAAWQHLGDEDMDSFTADIYRDREKDTGRLVELEL